MQVNCTASVVYWLFSVLKPKKIILVLVASPCIHRYTCIRHLVIAVSEVQVGGNYLRASVISPITEIIHLVSDTFDI
jgi:hypothetical protein